MVTDWARATEAKFKISWWDQATETRFLLLSLWHLLFKPMNIYTRLAKLIIKLVCMGPIQTDVSVASFWELQHAIISCTHDFLSKLVEDRHAGGASALVSTVVTSAHVSQMINTHGQLRTWRWEHWPQRRIWKKPPNKVGQWGDRKGK